MSSSGDLNKTLSRLSMADEHNTMPEQPESAFATLTRGPRALFGAGRGKLASLFGAEEASTVPAAVSSQAEHTSDEDSTANAAAAFCYEAGVDCFDRRILVLSLASLPDPARVSFDSLLHETLQRVAMVCEDDYVLVLMAAKRAGGATPGWRWIANAHSMLERRYRKNLKKLYVVHPSTFIRFSLPLLLPLVSPKFLQKLVYIYTLSELSQHIPIQQLCLGLDVLIENGKQESQGFADFGGLPQEEANTDGRRRAAFEVPLESLMPEKGAAIPKVLQECAAFIRSTSSIESEGIFRRSSNLVLVRQVASAYDHDVKVHLAIYQDPNLPGHLIKKLLRELPEPLIHERLFELVRLCPLPVTDAIIFLRETFLPALEWRERTVFAFIIHLLHDVAQHSARNLMTASNLAIVTSPVLIRSSDPITDALMCSIPGSGTIKALSAAGLSKGGGQESSMTVAGLMQICIERFAEVFAEGEAKDEWELVDGPAVASRLSQQARPAITHDLFKPASSPTQTLGMKGSSAFPQQSSDAAAATTGALQQTAVSAATHEQ